MSVLVAISWIVSFPALLWPGLNMHTGALRRRLYAVLGRLNGPHCHARYCNLVQSTLNGTMGYLYILPARCTEAPPISKSRRLREM